MIPVGEFLGSPSICIIMARIVVDLTFVFSLIVQPLLKQGLLELIYTQAQFSEARLQGEVRQLPIGMHGLYTGAHRAAPPQLFFGQGAPGMLPPHHARNGDQQHPFIPRIRPGATPNFMMPFPFQRGGQIGVHLGNGHQLQLQQQHSGAQNSQYMSNAGNGHDPSVLHQGQVRPMTPMPSTSVGVVRSAPQSVSALASAQPVASPNTQSMV